MIYRLFLFFFSLLLFSDVYADYPKTPFLRIENGFHMGKINRIAIDQDETILASVSGDKTLRLWNPRSGQLIRTIRVPIGEGDIGKLYSVALTPDGQTVAVGGFTGGYGGGKDIFLFDTATGEMTSRIDDLNDVIHHLAYSTDGRYLAAVLGSTGLRVFQSDGSLAFEDQDYGKDAFSAHFSADGRLVTTCDDGYLRLYSSAEAFFALIAKKRAPGGAEPFQARFSPDGERIAVTFSDKKAINLLSSEDLSLIASPSTEGGDESSFYSITWSTDGRYFYAAGAWDAENESAIRRWSAYKKDDRYQDFYFGLTNSVIDMLPRAEGGIFISSQDPSLLATDQHDEAIWQHLPKQADYRNNLEGFKVSTTGEQVQISLDNFGEKPLIFSLKTRRLEDVDLGAKLSPPDTASYEDLLVESWWGEYNPTLNGQRLPFDQGETSRALAIAPDQKHFLLGSDWNLRYFDASGEAVWTMPMPDIAWSVNITPDGHKAVVAFGDGQVRWYDLRDGSELITLYLQKNRDWILYTPEGFYMASPNGEKLIGYHVNRDIEQSARFFSVNKWRHLLHRPDLVMKKFHGDRAAVQEAFKKVQKGGMMEEFKSIINQFNP
ncbi:WD40 repeat domain-containing protein [Magnetococcales bacterium HHB-1]